MLRYLDVEVAASLDPETCQLTPNREWEYSRRNDRPDAVEEQFWTRASEAKLAERHAGLPLPSLPAQVELRS